jgi:hypothetical protein
MQLSHEPRREHRFPVRNLLWSLPSNDHCLQSHYLASGLHATAIDTLFHKGNIIYLNTSTVFTSRTVATSTVLLDHYYILGIPGTTRSKFNSDRHYYVRKNGHTCRYQDNRRRHSVAKRASTSGKEGNGWYSNSRNFIFFVLFNSTLFNNR